MGLKDRKWVVPGMVLGGILLVLGVVFSFHNVKTRQRPNVLLLILDTVRADSIDSAIGGKQRTPNIAEVLSQGTKFVNAFTPAPWTLPSHASLFTGLYPYRHKATHGHFKLDATFDTIAERLQSVGYSTAGFSCNPWVSRANGFAQGFDLYQEPFRFAETGEDKGGSRATKMIVDWIERHASLDESDDTPFFLFANFLEAHLPYHPPWRVLKKLEFTDPGSVNTQFTIEQAEQHIIGEEPLTADGLARAQALYRAEIHYLDMQVGEILTSLKKHDLLDDTILIITSDHGEHIGEQHLMGHEFSLYESLLRVPLIVRYPARIPVGKRSAVDVSLVDLFPTILEMTNLKDNAYDGKGRSLLESLTAEEAEDRPIFAEYSQPRKLVDQYWRGKYPQVDMSRYNVAIKSVRMGGYKYILTSDGREGLYFLSEDPNERRNMSSSLAEKSASLREVVFRELAMPESSAQPRQQEAGSDSTSEANAELIKRLRSLGYVR